MHLPFVWVDVFAPGPLTGNQLCVFRALEGMEAGLMARIARELNHSETTFLQRPTSGRADVRVRIFVPNPAGAEEIPFAGHPVLGSACAAAELLGAGGDGPGGGSGDVAGPGGDGVTGVGRPATAGGDGPGGSAAVGVDLPGRPGASVIRVETGAGIIPVTVTPLAGGVWEATMAQPLPRVVRRWDDPAGDAAGFRRSLASALGLEPTDLEPDLPVEAVDNGMQTTIIPLASQEALRRARPEMGALRTLLGRAGLCTLLFARGGQEPESDAAVRVFGPFDLVAEDPATGSANGPLGEYLVRHGVCPGPVIRTEQGDLVGRPSRLRIEVRREGGRTAAVMVGGQVYRLGAGAFDL